MQKDFSLSLSQSILVHRLNIWWTHILATAKMFPPNFSSSYSIVRSYIKRYISQGRDNYLRSYISFRSLSFVAKSMASSSLWLSDLALSASISISHLWFVGFERPPTSFTDSKRTPSSPGVLAYSANGSLGYVGCVQGCHVSGGQPDLFRWKE